MRLKADKAKMYELVSEHVSIPATMENTVFEYSKICERWAISWHEDNENNENKGKAYMAAFGGSPYLLIRTGAMGAPRPGSAVVRLDADDLIERDMIER